MTVARMNPIMLELIKEVTKVGTKIDGVASSLQVFSCWWTGHQLKLRREPFPPNQCASHYVWLECDCGKRAKRGKATPWERAEDLQGIATGTIISDCTEPEDNEDVRVCECHPGVFWRQSKALFKVILPTGKMQDAPGLVSARGYATRHGFDGKDLVNTYTFTKDEWNGMQRA